MKICPSFDIESILNIDTFRIGWEFIDHGRYTYWGNRRAVVVQFSRGCPHVCNYCGQRGFWTRWRHRDSQKFAAELAWLYRNHGVEVINFADENPTASGKARLAFLEAIIAENVPLKTFGESHKHGNKMQCKVWCGASPSAKMRLPNHPCTLPRQTVGNCLIRKPWRAC